MTFEIISHKGWKHCGRLANAHAELIITLDVGPRILSYSLLGAKNVFKNYPDMMGVTAGTEWLIFGGHRLWHAPEDPVRTYALDFDPVGHAWDGKTLVLTPAEEPGTGLRKEIEITLDPHGAQVRVVHRIHNHNLWDVEFAPWALSVMDVGTRAMVPQEPYGAHPDHLLPARPVVLWRFTNMADPRWAWGQRYVQLQQRPDSPLPQKVGFFNSLGWAACAVNGQIFVVKYPVNKGLPHADMGANTELFTNEDMLEVETLGPIARVAPGHSAEHVEHWGLFAGTVGPGDTDIDRAVLPLLGKVRDV
jgi:hypothetical protein